MTASSGTAKLAALASAPGAATPTPAASGIDAIALGDVNGDQVADIAVASRSHGQNQVTIYSGDGTGSATAATGFVSKTLVTLVSPLGASYAGPLSIALGDFLGNGTAQLAIAPASATRGSGPIGITLESFGVTDPAASNAPVDAAVSATAIATGYLPAGMATSTGFTLAAGRLGGGSQVDLVAAPATGGGSTIAVAQYNATGGWQETESIGSIPVSTRRGLSVSAGDLTGDGRADLAVGSKATGFVGLYSGATHSWMRNRGPLGPGARGTQVAIVAGTHQPGTLVATGTTAAGNQQVAVWSWHGASTTQTTYNGAATGIGSGNLVLASGGMVYQRSTMSNVAGSFPTASGPITPTVLFGTTTGTNVVAQGFTYGNSPSSLDTYLEPLDGTSSFLPLLPRKDPDVADSLPVTDSIDANIIAAPANTYTSPYSINLAAAPAGFDQGLQTTTSAANPTNSPWGPSRVANAPPSFLSDGSTGSVGVTVNEELRERVLAALKSVIGIDYQHHHDALWTPAQSSKWNVTPTVGYQSQGIDCTNLTAWAYSNALGLTMTGATGDQAKITSADINAPASDPSAVAVPTSVVSHVVFQTIARPTAAEGYATPLAQYNELVSELKPGDILYIDGTQGGAPTHGITWLGEYGTDRNGRSVPLILDATGITPDHVDSDGQVIPEGVHIRPFAPPDPNGSIGLPNTWYFRCFDHALQIIAS